jgi:hypothetical protein
MQNSYSFPPKGSPYAAEMTQFYQFWASRWSSFNSKRSRPKIRQEAEVSITLPFPRSVMTDNSVRYNEMGAQTGGGFYERVVSDTASSPIGALSGGWNFWDYLVDTGTAPLSKALSAFTGGDTIPYDDTETNFLPGAKRRHSFEFLLIAKTEQEASIASKIAYTFQLYTHPSANTASNYTMQHPLLWTFKAYNKKGPSGWDNQPLVSVLQSCRVSKIPFNSIPYSFPNNFQPVGTLINLAFVEMEPALRDGDKLVSRSERLYGQNDGSDLNKF